MGRFLIDESLPRAVATALAAIGHDAADARDVGLRGAPDGAVHARAVAEGRILITGDTDFANTLRFQPGTHAGIVVLRVPSAWSPAERARRIVEALDEMLVAQLTGATAIVAPARVRLLAPRRA